MDWDMLGHAWAVELLARDVAKGNLRHAYLFSGEQGVGRRTLALRLTQALNCPTPPTPGDACRNCRTCRQIEHMSYPDLAIVQADQQGGTLRVDQVRELLHSLALAPYEAKFRVALLLRFEEAHISAMNALLKTLEEPASRVVIVLTAESAESLIPTIASRCEIVRLRSMPFPELSQGLRERWGIPDEKADLLSHLSGGRPGTALRMHQEPVLLENRKMWLDAHERLFTASRRERFAFAENLSKDREALRTALIIWLSLWRDVLLVALGASCPIANLDRAEDIQQVAERLGLEAAHSMVASVGRTLDLVERNVNQRLALEVLLLDLPTLNKP